MGARESGPAALGPPRQAASANVSLPEAFPEAFPVRQAGDASGGVSVGVGASGVWSGVGPDAGCAFGGRRLRVGARALRILCGDAGMGCASVGGFLLREVALRELVVGVGGVQKSLWACTVH